MPPATATDLTPLACFRLSRTLRTANAASRSDPSGSGRRAAASPSVGKPNSAVRARSIMTPATTRNGTAMPICTIAAMRWMRMVCRPPAPTSSFSAGSSVGRLNRMAGSSPNSMLTTRHSPNAIATLAASRSISSGIGTPNFQPMMAGTPNSTNALIAPPANASTSASKNRWRINRCRLAPSAARIDSSRSRVAPRTSIMPEMFRHTISNTVPARLRRTLMTRVDSGLPAAPIEA